MESTFLYHNNRLHIVNSEMIDNKSYVALYANEVYNKNIMLDKFMGAKKITIALETHKSEIKISSKTFKTTIIKELEGSNDYGYNHKIASSKFQDSVKAFEELDIKCLALKNNFELSDDDISLVKQTSFNTNFVLE